MLLKTSAVNFKNLSLINQETFNDYATLNPEFKSGINVMIKVNINANYSLKTSFNPIDSIVPESTPPVSPILEILSWDPAINTFSVEWEPAIESGSQIRLYVLCTFNNPPSANAYYPFFLIGSALDYSREIYIKNLQIYNFIGIKGKYVNPEGLESSLSAPYIYNHN